MLFRGGSTLSMLATPTHKQHLMSKPPSAHLVVVRARVLAPDDLHPVLACMVHVLVRV